MVSSETLNKVWITILIIIGILFLCYYVFGFDIIKSIKNAPLKVGSELTKQATLNDDYCIKNIIPEKIIIEFPKPVYSSPTEQQTLLRYWTSTWKDGTGIEAIGDRNVGYFYECRWGSEEGENQNYNYCDGLRYSKTLISKDGTIGETIIYRVDLVLNRVNMEEVKSGLRDILNQTFEIVDFRCYKS